MSKHSVGMVLLTRGQRAERALDTLAAALPDGEVDEPDDDGTFEVHVDADDQDEALEQVWNAVAAAGADDHIAFAEHPGLPEHWRHRAQAPGGDA